MITHLFNTGDNPQIFELNIVSSYVIDSCGVRRSATSVVCRECGIVFLKQNKAIARTKSAHHFCSTTCSRKNKQVEEVDIVCAYCGDTKKRKKSRLKSKSGFYFCSLLCRNKAAALDGLEDFKPAHYGKAKRKKGICTVCGFPTGDQSYRCKDHKLDTYEVYIAKWKKGEVSGNWGCGEALHEKVRRYLFDKYNSQCCKCGWGEMNPVTGKIPLTVNHIDGNSGNSQEDNLELICPNVIL